MPVMPFPRAPLAVPRSPLPRRFLVTGAGGFIGSHLTTRLVADGHEVHALTRTGGHPSSAVCQWRVDLADATTTTRVISTVQPDVVIHLASRATGDRSLQGVAPMVRDNLLSSVNVMSAVVTHAPGARVVMAGSIEEPRSLVPGYGALSPYAAAKAANTTYATLFRDLWKLPVTVLRLAMVYGPGDPNNERLMPHTVRGFVTGDAPRLSSGRRAIDWLYIDDAIDAFVAASVDESTAGAVLDVGSGVPVTIRATVERIAALAASQVRPVYGAVPDRAEDRAHIADPEPARDALGWQARIGLDEGLRRTIAWYRRSLRTASCEISGDCNTSAGQTVPS